MALPVKQTRFLYGTLSADSSESGGVSFHFFFEDATALSVLGTKVFTSFDAFVVFLTCRRRR